MNGSEDRDPETRSRWLTPLVFGIAVFLGLWVTVTPDAASGRGAQLAWGAIAVTGLMVGSRLPVLAVVVTAAATSFAWLVGVTADPFVLTGFAVFRLAEMRGGRRFPWWMFAGAFVVVVASAILSVEDTEDRARGMLLSALVLSVAWVLGARTREVRREAAARSRAEERLRLARDVHDVLSHSLGTIGVHAGVAAHVTALGADELREALRGIESDARSSLSELSTLLRRERSDLEPDDVVSSPLSSLLAGVARTAEKAGLSVHLDVGDDIDALPADVRTTLLRIVQEALTNVVRHASASSVTVGLRISSDEVTIGVADDGQGARGEISLGNGLTGVRERAVLLGGRADFTSSTSGFTVSATVPLRRRSAGVRG
ncbi:MULTISPECIES: sensor histidine kinase [Microbacterium]|uniref:sensor histidine kinase n=1 Tax=Microbacterium TaxID=33882 RepID=UPI0006F8D716|nr:MULTISPECIES: histidine kinase [Microbacterium]KQZ25080.1 hypothetical protein ASD43_12515 [Microbacterium sp. Root553]